MKDIGEVAGKSPHSSPITPSFDRMDLAFAEKISKLKF